MSEKEPGEGLCMLCGRGLAEAGPFLVTPEGLLCRSCKHSRVRVHDELPPVHEGGTAESIADDDAAGGPEDEKGQSDGPEREN